MTNYVRPKITDLATALEWINTLEESFGLQCYFAPELKLTETETLILGTLYKVDKVMTRERLYTLIYGLHENPPSGRVMDIWILRLRMRLTPFGIKIQTVYGQGWYISPEDRDKIAKLEIKGQTKGQAA